jgi:ABC-type transport system involved in multi-copper enzyme maturation permease subunit
VSLYRAETRRLFKRRIVRVLLIGAVVILAAVAAGVFFTNHKIDAGQLATAQVKADQEFKQQTSYATQARADCDKAKGTAAAGQFPPNCEDITPPGKENFDPKNYLAPTFTLKSNYRDMITTLAGVLAMVAFVIGASFVGAEWNSGGMMNLLLWRPKRLQVVSTKLLALVLGLTAVTVVLGAIWTGLFTLIAHFRGTTEGMTSGVWQSFAIMGARGLALVLVAGIVGFTLASIGRHTAMAFGVAIGVVVLLQIGLGTVLGLAKVKFVESYLLPYWVIAWMNKSVKLEDYSVCNFSLNGDCAPDVRTLTWQVGGTGALVLVALLVGGSLWTIRSRDVT